MSREKRETVLLGTQSWKVCDYKSGTPPTRHTLWVLTSLGSWTEPSLPLGYSGQGRLYLHPGTIAGISRPQFSRSGLTLLLSPVPGTSYFPSCPRTVPQQPTRNPVRHCARESDPIRKMNTRLPSTTGNKDVPPLRSLLCYVTQLTRAELETMLLSPS